MRWNQSRVIDRPEPGFFRLRFARGGPWMPARIIFAADLWGAEINGRPAGLPHRDPHMAPGVMRVWQGGRRINAEDYAYLLTLLEYAQDHPAHPMADPCSRIDVSRLPPVF